MSDKIIQNKTYSIRGSGDQTELMINTTQLQLKYLLEMITKKDANFQRNEKIHIFLLINIIGLQLLPS